MPPLVEISCFTILIDRQNERDRLYRRGGAFARIRLDFCVMRRVREWGMGNGESRIEDRRYRIEAFNLAILDLPSSILGLPTPHSPLPTPYSPSSAHQIHKSPQADACGADRQIRFAVFVPGRACDVQVRPGGVLGEFTDEISAGDRARFAPAHVFDVGDLALDLFAVIFVER